MVVSISAPGKVLIVGGYLIVEQENVGISVGITARFTTLCRASEVKKIQWPAGNLNNGSTQGKGQQNIIQVINKNLYQFNVKEVIKVKVHSPQFNKVYQYQSFINDKDNVITIQRKGQQSPFLQNAIHFTVASNVIKRNSYAERNVCNNNANALSRDVLTKQTFPYTHTQQSCNTSNEKVSKQNLQNYYVERFFQLELLADNDFYSQRNYLNSVQLPVTVNNLRALPPHLRIVGKVSKTGLGSSASMTTSVVACLYYFLQKNFNVDGAIDINNLTHKQTIHRIAQIAHNVAQNKIGSGFDVYTAVYGTSAYRRFPASKVSKLFQIKTQLCKDQQTVSKQLITNSNSQLQACLDLNDVWVTHLPFSLPKSVHLILADIHKGGSSTPGMVAKIMNWRHSKQVVDEGDNSIWCKLGRRNRTYVQLFQTLLQRQVQSTQQYTAAVQRLQLISNIMSHHSQSDIENLFIQTAQCANKCRQYLRAIGNKAGVGVEPPQLTELLDKTAQLPGVLAVGCPGAGGYDAVFALVLENENIDAQTVSPLKKVQQFWQDYTNLQVCPLLVREDNEGLKVSLVEYQRYRECHKLQ